VLPNTRSLPNPTLRILSYNKEAVLKMILFDDLLNSFSFIDNVRVIRMLYFFCEYSINKIIDRARVNQDIESQVLDVI